MYTNSLFIKILFFLTHTLRERLDPPYLQVICLNFGGENLNLSSQHKTPGQP